MSPYKPIVWSCYGGPHAQSMSVLRTLSRRLSRRRGIAAPSEVYQHLHGSITAEIWREAARQVMDCMPLQSPLDAPT